MTDIQRELKVFWQEWQAWCRLVTGHDFGGRRPIHVGWKVASEATVAKLVAELLPESDQVHVGTVDDRKIALLALHQPLEQVPILQIMQRRPGSADALGLDHVAFHYDDLVELQEVLEASPYKWERQSNTGHSWLSLWFGERQREVKFFDHTSLDVAARELVEASKQILGRD
jgi:hypothetical protein